MPASTYWRVNPPHCKAGESTIPALYRTVQGGSCTSAHKTLLYIIHNYQFERFVPKHRDEQFELLEWIERLACDELSRIERFELILLWSGEKDADITFIIIRRTNQLNTHTTL